ncbi:hypothetical protein [Dechloromonas denitrificans]|uniref:hypothetical protein n=1 Tax=Dechloromonas denitrificans TaxID=281362 RepID=UPI001CF9351B|nr:hypothetical protein [Dechloromonas denitrificans]UCV09598.1 hypothetical protein KI615_08830 [Dechloromonas denitrificans]
MRTFFALFLLVTAQLFPVSGFAGEEVCSIVTGAVIIAQNDENTFLGKVTNTYDSKSIFNDYGPHGSEYSSSSIWNQYGTFGGEYSTFSPFNKYTSTPPMIIKNKKVIGYLSANKSLQSAISPNLLKALCKDEL